MNADHQLTLPKPPELVIRPQDWIEFEDLPSTADLIRGNLAYRRFWDRAELSTGMHYYPGKQARETKTLAGYLAYVGAPLC